MITISSASQPRPAGHLWYSNDPRGLRAVICSSLHALVLMLVLSLSLGATATSTADSAVRPAGDILIFTTNATTDRFTGSPSDGDYGLAVRIACSSSPSFRRSPMREIVTSCKCCSCRTVSPVSDTDT